MTEKTFNQLFRALITGFLGAFVIMALFGMDHLSKGWHLFWITCSLVSTFTWLITTLVNWNFETRYTQREVVYPIDSAFPDRSEAAAEQGTTINLISRERGANYPRGKYSSLPVTPDELIAVAERFMQTGKFTHAEMGGAGKPLTRAQFENLRSAMIREELAKEVNPGQSNSPVTLTHDGLLLFQSLAASSNAQAHTYTQR